jgi:hypothetical protein
MLPARHIRVDVSKVALVNLQTKFGFSWYPGGHEVINTSKTGYRQYGPVDLKPFFNVQGSHRIAFSDTNVPISVNA